MRPRGATRVAATAAAWALVCTTCGTRVAFGPHVSGCPSCAERGAIGLLECVRPPGPPPRRPEGRVRGMARYHHLLPQADGVEWISLGEGGTALVPSRHIGPALGLDRLYFKLEQQNPTSSFKDRYVALTLNVARHFGFRRTVVSSTGNLGVSVAAYSAYCGMACHFVAPDEVPPNIQLEAALFGADVELVDKARRFTRFEAIASDADCFPVGLFLARAVQNPFGVEAYRTFGYELLDDLGRVPDAVLFPCARGNGLYGAWKGFQDAIYWRWADRMPAMVACQPAQANSLEASLRSGSASAVALPPADSVARSICETTASDRALSAIRQSGGTAVSATDQEIIEAVRDLGREGINAEASAAVTVACLRSMLEEGNVASNATIVCILTGAGHRWPEQNSWLIR